MFPPGPDLSLMVRAGQVGPGAHLMQTFSQSDLSDKFCNGDILHSHHNSITLIRGLLTFYQVAPSLLQPKWKTEAKDFILVFDKKVDCWNGFELDK